MITSRKLRLRPTTRGRRPWTRAATAATGAHVIYELGAGVAMPLASKLGIEGTAALFGASTATAYLAAGRRPATWDPVFNALNGLYLAAVTAHFTSWPHRSGTRIPRLERCEGLEGPIIEPYNAILHVSLITAIGGVVENRHGRRWALTAFVLATPLLRNQAPKEYQRLTTQARAHPHWWNRRL